MRIKNLIQYKEEKEKFKINPEKLWAEKADTFTWHKKWEAKNI